MDAYEQQNPGSQLVSLFNSRDNSDELAATATNAEVRSFLADEAQRGINSTYTKLKERIDKFGVSQPITLQESTGRIIVELPGVDNPKQVRKLLQSTANLQFWETYTIQELSSNPTSANEAPSYRSGRGVDEIAEETPGDTTQAAENGEFFAQADTTAGDTTVESGLLNDTLLADEPLTDSTDAAAGLSSTRCCCLRVAVARSSDM